MSKIPSYNVGTIAKLLDLSERHVRRLVSDGVLIRNDGKNGKYPITNVTLYVKYLRERAFGTATGETDIHTEKLRIARTTADKNEIELERIKESLIDVETVLKTWDELVYNIKSKLLNLPSKIAHQIIGVEDYPTAENLLKKEVYEALDELSRIKYKNTEKSIMESDSKEVQTSEKN